MRYVMNNSLRQYQSTIWTIVWSICCALFVVSSGWAQSDDDLFGDDDGFSFDEDEISDDATGDDEMDFGDDDTSIDAPPELDESPKKKKKKRKKDDEVDETDLDQYDRIKSISRKKVLKAKRFEVSPAFSLSTNDAFVQHYAASLRGTYHILDSVALDFGGFANILPESIRLPAQDEVRRNTRNLLSEGRLHGAFDLGFAFSPVYGKFSILGKNIIHFDLFLTTAVGFVLDGNDGTAFKSGNLAFNPALEIGAGGRVFLNDWFALRFELRDYVYVLRQNPFSVKQNLLMFNMGVGFFLPTSFKYKNNAAKVVDL